MCLLAVHQQQSRSSLCLHLRNGLIDRLSVIWKTDLTDKMKHSFFQAAVVSILPHGSTMWTLTKRMEKKLDGNYTRILQAILNKSLRQHPKKQQRYGHLPPIMKIVKVRRTRHAEHWWRSKDELISDVLFWNPSHGRAKAGRPGGTDIQWLCADTGCSPEDLLEAMDDRKGWRERVKDIRADDATWWWLQPWWESFRSTFLFPSPLKSAHYFNYSFVELLLLEIAFFNFGFPIFPHKFLDIKVISLSVSTFYAA